MKKILSLALVLAMVLAMLPMMFMTVAAEPAEAELVTAPAKLPDGKLFETESLFTDPDWKIQLNDATMVKKWLNPASSAEVMANGFNNAKGIMFKIDASNVVAGEEILRLSFMIRLEDGNNLETAIVTNAGCVQGYFSDAAVPETPSTWYISENGGEWESIVDSTKYGVKPTTDNRGVTYVYIPFSEMYMRHNLEYFQTGVADNAKPAASFSEATEASGNWRVLENDGVMTNEVIYFRIGSASGSMLAASVSELSFVYEKEVEAPATLPDGKEYITESLFADPNKSFAIKSQEMPEPIWMSTTSADVIGEGLNNAQGIMFKIDASNVAAGEESLSLAIMMSITGNNSVESNLLSNSGRVTGYYSDAQKPATPSTWYISEDGGTWEAIVDPTQYSVKPITNYRGVTYVYIPFSEMYMRHDLSYYTSNGASGDASKPAASFYEAKEACGGWAAAQNMVMIRYGSASGPMLSSIFSEFSFVYSADPLIDTPADIFQSVNITATDDIAYNLFASIPEGATNVTMTYQFNGKTYTVVGVEQEDGTVKYTLKNVLPQYMGQDIVATWTATVGDEIVTDTYTSSIENYLKAILAGKRYADIHDVATALLYYGAAAQTVAGSTDAAVNTDVDPLPHPTNCKELPSAYNNGAKAIWTTAALRLSTTITLKVGVTAPEGITQVQYTIGEKTAVVDIKDGYVYIPVNAYQMMDTITLKCFDGSAATEDGALEITASYYLNIVDTEDANMNALLEAIANYAAQATIAAGGRTGSVEKAYSTVAQMALYDDFGGMSNVIQLTDGSFIIIDGGTNTEANVDALWAYLWRNSGYTKPVISAWIFTHLDLDHTDLGFAFLAKYKNDITVKTVGYTFPDNYQTLFAVKEGDSDQIKDYKNNAIGLQSERLATFESIKKFYPTTEFWDMEKGDVKTFADVQAKVLLSANEVTASNPFEHNQLSAVIQFVFTQKTEDTADDTTYLVWGDSTSDRLVAVANEYDIKSDVMQATHHGLLGGVKSTYEEVDPTVVLIPIKEAKHKTYAHYNYDFSVWIRNNSWFYYHDNTYVVNMSDLTISSQSVTMWK